MQKILLTGGLGFIGSHTAVELINDGYYVVIIDNVSNSSLDVLDKIKNITKSKTIEFYHGDISDEIVLNEIFNTHDIDTVIHFAGHKAVGESVRNPLKYYDNNITALIKLLNAMVKFDVSNFIFSSSATVYGIPEKLPLSEKSLLCAINPYGQTKLMGEQILRDASKAYNINVILLRYFNPVGAHKSGLIGENPSNPTNLFPYILEVVKGERECLNIYGNDYDTTDGTPIRDYIHVVDLAKGHVKGVKYINDIETINIYNLGSGKGYSVLNIIDTFNKILDRTEYDPVKYRFSDRREGDAPVVYADCSLAKDELGWVAGEGLEQMIIDSLNFLKVSN